MICEYCGIEFENKNTKDKRTRRFCCKSHAAIFLAVERKKDEVKYEEWKNKLSVSNTERYKDPKLLEELSIRSKKFWNDEGNKEKMKIIIKEVQNRPEVKEKIKNSNRKYYDSEEGKKEMSDRAKKLWENNEIRNKRINSFKDAQNRPEVKEKLSEIRKEIWKNPEIAKKMMISKYKDYILPSGKSIKIQGYEERALDELLKRYDESDIIIGVSDILKIIGNIEYKIDNEKHTYYPDFFILSENKIIEVKSEWTYNLHKDINECKKERCIELGYSFDFLIFKSQRYSKYIRDNKSD